MWVLFADGEQTGVVYGIVGLLAGIIIALGTAIVNIMVNRARISQEAEAAKSKISRDERGDVVLEWKTFAHETQERLDSEVSKAQTRYEALNARHDKLTEEVFQLHRDNAECIRRETEREGEMRLLKTTMQRLQTQSGDTLSPSVLTITAGLDGVVRTVSPSVSALLHWLPADLIRKNVEMIVPERLREQHRTALAKVAQTGSPPWTERVLSTWALTSDGQEVPVDVNLVGWQSGSGEFFVTAEVRKRLLATVTAPVAGSEKPGT